MENMQRREELKEPEQEKREDSESEKSDSSEERSEKEEEFSPNLPSINNLNSFPSTEGEDKDVNRNGLPSTQTISKSPRGSSNKSTSPLVMQWLQDNYEPMEGSSLPRSTLYAHYTGFCSSLNIEPVNSASFGKLIRQLFPNLKTRRLGTRGHSKYHYYGIQIKNTSDLRLPNFQSQNEVAIGAIKPKIKHKREIEPTEKVRETPQQPTSPSVYHEVPPSITPGATLISLPDFSITENINIPEMMFEQAQTFMSIYKKHCQTMVDFVYRQQFQEVDKIMRSFWQNLPNHYRNLLMLPDFAELIAKRDFVTYRTLTQVLLPNVLASLPVSIPQSIRQFAKQIEHWLTAALEGYPPHLATKKLQICKMFSYSLHKQASLNHLTHAARSVLQNTSQITQMIFDWNKLDFDFIRSQTGWVCACPEEYVQKILEDFKVMLAERVPLEQFASWIQGVVYRFLDRANDSKDVVHNAQQLLLKWSFYSTLIIRDLTIRNAPSFGSFHLLRTLFDEYIFYLVDNKIQPLVLPQLQMPMEGYLPMYSIGEVQTHGTNLETMSSFENLLNKDTNRIPKHLPFPFQQDTSHHERPMTQEYAREIPHEGLMNLQNQPQYSRVNPYQNFPKTLDDLRYVANNYDRLNANNKRPNAQPEMYKPNSNVVYGGGYQIPESLRVQLPPGHSLDSLMNSSQFRDSNEPATNKKMRLDSSTAEVK